MKLDGNDPVALYNGMKEVVEAVRAGEGPVFVEAMTLRLGRHAGIGDNPDLSMKSWKSARRKRRWSRCVRC